MFKRFVHVGSKLTKQEVASLLNKPTWKAKDLIKNTKLDALAIKVDTAIIRKMLRLSGLKSDITVEEEEVLVKSLKAQMAFIKHLYKNDTEGFDQQYENNESYFRLVAEDHVEQPPLTLQALKNQIARLPQEVDAEKGETSGFDINKLHPRHKTYFSIRS